jgi:ABC-2 type transport system permease protein
MTTEALPLHDVQGPSALGGGWRRFGRLTWLISKTDYKLTYFDSVLGYLWSLMQPLLFFGVLYVVFSVLISSVNKGAKDFPVLLLMNIVLFSFFQAATGSSIPAVVAREGLVRKMHFPRLVIPLASVMTAAMNMALNLLVVILFMLFYGVTPRWTWLLLPFLVALLFLFTSGVAMLLSALYVRYRDVGPIWSVISQALYFASPVFILIDNIAAKHHGLVRYYLFNPIAMILQQARHWMVGGSPGVPHYMGGYAWLAVPLGILFGVVLLGFWVFDREAPRIAEEL